MTGGRRKREVRARTINVKRITKSYREMFFLPVVEDDVVRPRTRGDCSQIERPCPFVACKHHLYLDVTESTGSIKLNFPDIEVSEMSATCVLDLADDGGMTLDEIGDALNVTRERVRQIEARGLARLGRTK